jgi:hypothetical protein
VVPTKPTLDAVIEGRNRGNKDRKFQRRAGMGKEVLWGSISAENGETSNTYMEYGLFPPRRIESRRNREMNEKEVQTMAAAKKSAPGCDWHISLCTAAAKVRIQKNGDTLLASNRTVLSGERQDIGKPECALTSLCTKNTRGVGIRN